ncbi:calcium homeostasis modulator protein 5-like isoform X2 [Rhincodon typus]|uniref:calcium homeostasis modulator protein 5-like isoform X2 n=1 Tax=Rhincodon typus TaxID=259920 RepID=UPI00202F008C|nr:calcium homeostasis modulator protein 5-like isoform X2 [Rhincodon typus]
MHPSILEKLKKLMQNEESFMIRSSFLVLILYGLEQLLKTKLPCPCTINRDNEIFAYCFFCLPSAMLLMVSVMLQFSQLRWSCYKKKCACLKYFITYAFLIFKALLPSVIWITVLFLDGSYYSCFMIMKNVTVTKEACLNFRCSKGQQHHCDLSRFIGGLLICGFLVILLSLYCCSRCPWCGMRYHHYKYEYDKRCEGKRQKLIMEALESRADDEARTLFANMSNGLRTYLNSVSEIQRYQNGDDTTSGVPPDTGDAPSVQAQIHHLHIVDSPLIKVQSQIVPKGNVSIALFIDIVVILSM